LCVALGKNRGIIGTGGSDKRTCVWTLKQLKEKEKPILVWEFLS
jgi:hypothetical protein